MSKALPQLDDLIEGIASSVRTPLENLSESVGLAHHLGEMADHLIGHFVDQARNAGASWAEIGEALGVTKQAAQKRFVPRRPMEDGKQLLFSRFNDEARAVVMESMEQARGSGHDHIDTGHIVLALVANPKGLAARAIAAQGVSPDEVRAAIHATLGPASDVPIPEHVPWSPGAKKVLELSLREAFRRQAGQIGPEHILLGVLRDQKSATAMCLAVLGVNRKEIENAIPR
ncbi:MAG: Clp protease N-terminal domain-containing protein [Acidimicrobiia bacterium]